MTLWTPPKVIALPNAAHGLGVWLLAADSLLQAVLAVTLTAVAVKTVL